MAMLSELDLKCTTIVIGQAMANLCEIKWLEAQRLCNNTSEKKFANATHLQEMIQLVKMSSGFFNLNCSQR